MLYIETDHEILMQLCETQRCIKTEFTVASWNITADFFDKKEEEYQIHNWNNRQPSVLKTLKNLNNDIIGLQELSPNQAVIISEIKEYQSLFLSQTPSDIEPGLIVDGLGVKDWINKNIGTPLIGLLFKPDIYDIIQQGRFWLKEDPDSLPIYKDRSLTDKGFGNMNTYRAVLWIKLKHKSTKKILFVFNSHYPLSGGPSTRLKCAEIERQKINEIAKDDLWISMGDRNIIFELGVLTKIGDLDAMKPLLYNAFDAVNSNHKGPMTTWAGFKYDKCTNIITNGEFEYPVRLDIIISNIQAISSHHIITQFDENEIILNPLKLEEKRQFASDHLIVVAFFEFYTKMFD